MSVDGKIAPSNRVGRTFAKFMTKRHQKLLHRIRSRVDAIVVGVDTVVADNPSLTVREVRGKNPIRVVLDSNARIPLDSKLLDTRKAQTIIAVTRKAPKNRIESLKGRNAEVFVSTRSDKVDLKELLRELSNRGVATVLVEGGGETRWSFVKESLVDEFFVWIMPRIWGGRHAPTMVDGEGFTKPQEAVALKLKRMRIVDRILMLWFSVTK